MFTEGVESNSTHLNLTSSGQESSLSFKASDTVFANNIGGGTGGMSISASDVLLERCNFNNNHGNRSSGGVRLRSTTHVVVDSCIFGNNTGQHMAVTRCFITQDHAIFPEVFGYPHFACSTDWGTRWSHAGYKSSAPMNESKPVLHAHNKAITACQYG